MSYVLVAAVVAGAGTQIWSAHEQSKALEANADFQSKISELNAQLALVDAQEAVRQGASQQARYAGEVEKAQAQQESFFAEQGVEIQDDATGALLAESSLNAALNKAEIENQAYLKAAGYRREADNIRGQSAANQYESRLAQRSALISGYAGAVGTVASAAISSASAKNAAKIKQGG
jgi:hypothetical protein